MRLLPSQQAARVEKAIAEFQQKGKFTIYEPCDCNGYTRHNNGGNYHEIIYLARDSDRYFRQDASTSDYDTSDWQETTEQDCLDTIKDLSDWL